MSVMQEISDKIEKGEAHGLFGMERSNKAINDDGEMVVFSNERSLPALLGNLVKEKKIEIRDYQITSKDDKFFVRIWICPLR